MKESLYRQSRTKSSLDYSLNRSNLTNSEKEEEDFYSLPISDLFKELIHDIDDCQRYHNYLFFNAISAVLSKTKESKEKINDIISDYMNEVCAENDEILKGSESKFRSCLELQNYKILKKIRKILNNETNIEKDIEKEIQAEKARFSENYEENLYLKIQIEYEERKASSNKSYYENIKNSFDKVVHTNENSLEKVYQEIDDLENNFNKFFSN